MRWLWAVLTDPSPQLDNPEDRRQSRLITLLLLFVIPLMVVSVSVQNWLVPSFRQYIHLSLLCMCCITLAYLMSRTRYFRVGAGFGLVTTLSVVAFMVAAGFNPVIFSSYVIIVLISAQIFRWHLVLVIAALNMLGIIFAAIFSPMLDFSATVSILSVTSIAGLMAALSSANRLHNAEQINRQNRELWESATLYRSLMNALAEGVALYDSSGQIITCNPNAELILGLTADQMMGHSLIDPRWITIQEDGTVFPQEQYPAIITLRTGDPQHGVIMGVYKPDDSLAWISVNTQPLFAPGADKPYAVVASFSDITENKRVEQLYRKDQRRYQALFEQANDAIFLVDSEGNLVEVNQCAVQMLGYNRASELAGKPAHIVLAPHEHNDSLNKINRILDGEEIPAYERIFRRKDGTLLSVELNVSLVRDDYGQPLYIQSVARDITERKRADSALRESERRYRTLFDDCPISLWEEDFSLSKQRIDALHDLGVTDIDAYLDENPDFVDECIANLRVLDVNKVGLKILGIESKDSALPQMPELIREQARELFKKQVIAIFQGCTHFEGDGIGYKATDERIDLNIQWTISPGYEDMSRVIVSILDITERKAAEQHWLELTAEKARAGALRRFINDAYHDLSTPLSVVNTSLYLLRHKLPPNADFTQVDKLEEQTAKLVHIVQDLRMMSQLDDEDENPVRLHTLNLNTIVRYVIAQHEMKAAARNQSLIVHTTSHPITIEADHIRISRAIESLIGNAIAYTPYGGEITVSTMIEDKHVVIEVRDNGIGISAEKLPHIFDPFFRAAEERPQDNGGSGLGLSIANRIVILHNGRITVNSHPGQGSVFRILLPLSV